MLRLAPLAILLLAPLAGGCASLARAGASGATAGEPTGTVELRLLVGEGRAVYRRAQSFSILDDGRGAAVRVEAPSHLVFSRQGDERFLELVDYEPLTYLSDGEPRAPHSSLYGLEHMTVRTLVDTRARVVEDPQATGHPATGTDVHSAVLAMLRLLRVTFPERPVAIGEQWTIAPIEWDTPPGHRIGVVVEPTWTLRGVERDRDDEQVALIDWDASFRVLPFAAMAGTTLEGTGRIRGTSRVRLSDGIGGRTELDLEVSVGPSGAAALVGLFRFEAKYTDVVEPTRETYRELVVPIRPRGARALPRVDRARVERVRARVNLPRVDPARVDRARAEPSHASPPDGEGEAPAPEDDE